MHQPTDRITHTTAFVAPVVEHWLDIIIIIIIYIYIYIYIYIHIDEMVKYGYTLFYRLLLLPYYD